MNSSFGKVKRPRHCSGSSVSSHQFLHHHERERDDFVVGGARALLPQAVVTDRVYSAERQGDNERDSLAISGGEIQGGDLRPGTGDVQFSMRAIEMRSVTERNIKSDPTNAGELI